MPLFILLALIIGLPLIEIYILIEVGAEIGALPTIALAILTAVIGTCWCVTRVSACCCGSVRWPIAASSRHWR